MGAIFDTTALMAPRQHPPEWYALQKRLFMEAIEPLTQMKLNIYNLYLPTTILDSEGNLIKSAYPEEAQALIKQVDEMIEQVAASWQR